MKLLSEEDVRDAELMQEIANLFEENLSIIDDLIHEQDTFEKLDKKYKEGQCINECLELIQAGLRIQSEGDTGSSTNVISTKLTGN